jgi:hypothetical protein
MAEMDITKTLVVGQNVFMRSGQVGNWAKVVKITPTGVIVESDPVYGAELIRFDKNGTACDSSDLCNDKGVRGGSTIPIMGAGPWKLYLNTKDAGFAKTIDSKAKELLKAGNLAEFLKTLDSESASRAAEFLNKRKRNS